MNEHFGEPLCQTTSQGNYKKSPGLCEGLFRDAVKPIFNKKLKLRLLSSAVGKLFN